MKTLLMSCLLGLFCLTAWGQQFALSEGNFADLQKKAKAENKPYFLYFYTGWCVPCKKINEQSLTSPHFAKYANGKVYGYRADAESDITGGKTLAQKYKVSFYPMFIVFTPEGMISERIDGYLSDQELIDLLKRNAQLHGQPSAKYLYGNDDPPRAALVKPEGQGLYHIQLTEQKSEGFGVQIAVYENHLQAIEKIKDLQKHFHRNIILHLSEENKKSYYHIILGPFQSMRSALTYNEVLQQKNGYSGSVIDLALLK